MSVTYEEIKQQYAALKQTYDYMLANRAKITDFLKKHSPSSAAFIGCGSGYCVSRSGAFSFQLRGGVPSMALAGGDLMLNAGQYSKMLEHALLVAPSRSGSTSEVVEAVRRINEYGRKPLIAISCVTGSPLSRIADLPLELPWAFDHSVCQTRTVTNLYTANLLLAAFAGGDEHLISEIGKAIQHGDAYMARVETSIRQIADSAWEHAVILADGELHGLAAEGAIALTEIANVQAHAYHLLDVRHGPMVTIGPDTLVIAALSDEGAEYQHKLMRDIKGRGARIIAFGDHAGIVPPDCADLVVHAETRLDTAAQGIPFIFIPQIVAVASAERRGIDPDHPDGLTAWVKL